MTSFPEDFVYDKSTGCDAKKYLNKILQKYWTDIWPSVNQKRSDLQKKQPKALRVGTLENNIDAVNPDEAANLDLR